ncbi:MAG: family 20 glycosylhydrolase [Ginsengibacter sp.]|jgi:hexosaminidase
MKIKNVLFAFLLLCASSIFAQQKEVFVVPQPVSITEHEGTFILTNKTLLVAGKTEKHEAEMLNFYLKKLYGFTLPIQAKAGKENALILKVSGKGRKDGYTLQSTEKQITITGGGNEGLFYGTQTLLQLLPAEKISSSYPVPAVSIQDYPRFNYRGMHLDVARHFFDVDFIKKYIDYLAYHKFNNFHWHLTEDQGWRIEIKKYPLLTSVGGYRNGTIIGNYPGTGNTNQRYGGFYTQEQVKDIVKYAMDRHINVIPEIEMPGHASAAIAAYPQLSCFPDEDTYISAKTPWAGSRKGKQVQQTFGVFDDIFAPTDYTFNFLENVLDEVLALFPSKYIHIGGDEAPKSNWKRSEFAQKLIKEKGLKDEHGLQSYFIQRIEKYLNSKGRKIIGWDEILEGGLAPNATVMSWQGEKGGIEAAEQNHDVMMTPNTYCYFDHSQTKNEDSVVIGGYLPLDKVYGYDPMPSKLDAAHAKHILGAQGNVWTEYMQYPSKVEYMIFPRMTALSEVVWTPKEKKSWDRFSSHITDIFNRYQFWGSSYSTAYFDLKQSVSPTKDQTGVLYNLESNFKEAVIHYKKNTDTDWQVYKEPVLISSSGSIQAYLETAGGNSSIISKDFFFNKATGKKISLKDESSKSYPGAGAFTLINGVITTNGLKDASEWLGFGGKDIEALIDLGKETPIKKVTLNTLDANGSWIYLPKTIEVFSSADGSNFNLLGSKNIDQKKDADTRKFTFPVDVTTRYVKVKAANLGKIPDNLPGGGNSAWLFADEIVIE